MFAFLCPLNFALGNLASAAGCALMFAFDWRQLARWPEDSEFGPPDDATTMTLNVGGLALILAGLFA